jgi:hypothetical protein
LPHADEKDGWTDMRKLNASFRNFANAPNNKIGNLRSIIIVARSRNHRSNGNVTMCLLSTAELHYTINNIKILNAQQKCFHGKFVNATIKRTRFVPIVSGLEL